jgi:predicted extracellular nuclease
LTTVFELPTLKYSTYDEIQIPVELASNLSFDGNEYTVVRPTSEVGDVTGSLSITIKIDESTRVVSVPTTIKAEVSSTASDLFISEYIEGSSNNKLIEIYNPTNSAIDLSGYKLELYSNGTASASQTLILSSANSKDNVSTILQPGKTAVIFHGSIEQVFIDSAVTNGVIMFVSSTVINFNGNDAVVLRKIDGNVVDSIGQIGNNPGTEWVANTVSTLNMTLVRKSYVYSGDTNPNDAFDPSIEWIAFSQNTATYVGTHTID